eukprot:scaffold23625_cov137-Cylindrotheca_fusiformis.AAC.4
MKRRHTETPVERLRFLSIKATNRNASRGDGLNSRAVGSNLSYCGIHHYQQDHPDSFHGQQENENCVLCRKAAIISNRNNKATKAAGSCISLEDDGKKKSKSGVNHTNW